MSGEGGEGRGGSGMVEILKGAKASQRRLIAEAGYGPPEGEGMENDRAMRAAVGGGERLEVRKEERESNWRGA
jgi:hypothetical protein